MKVYLSHSIMGWKGLTATDEDMKANCIKAVEFGNQLRKKFPTLNLYLPAEHEEFVHKAYKFKLLTIEQILDIDCAIVGEQDFLIVYAPDAHLSSGMRTEIQYAQECGITVLYLSNINQTKSIERYFKTCMKG